MELKNQIINDIEILPEHALRAVSVVIKEFIVLTSKTEPTARPVYGSGKGQMWFADDFDAPHGGVFSLTNAQKRVIIRKKGFMVCIYMIRKGRNFYEKPCFRAYYFDYINIYINGVYRRGI